MDGGKAGATMLPEQRLYPAEGQDVTDTAIRTTGLRDLYLALGDDRGGGRLTVRAYVSPAGAVDLAGRLGDGAGRRFDSVGTAAPLRTGEQAAAPAVAVAAE